MATIQQMSEFLAKYVRIIITECELQGNFPHAAQW